MSQTCHEATHAARKKHRYSITSSARERSVGGIVKPSVLAVLMLMTSSKLVAKGGEREKGSIAAAGST